MEPCIYKNLKKRKIPNAGKIKDAMQWIDNRLCVSTSHFHGYCCFTKKELKNQTDLEKIEECMIEIIKSSAYVLKEVRVLKNKRMQKNDQNGELT